MAEVLAIKTFDRSAPIKHERVTVGIELDLDGLESDGILSSDILESLIRAISIDRGGLGAAIAVNAAIKHAKDLREMRRERD